MLAFSCLRMAVKSTLVAHTTTISSHALWILNILVFDRRETLFLGFIGYEMGKENKFNLFHLFNSTSKGQQLKFCKTQI